LGQETSKYNSKERHRIYKKPRLKMLPHPFGRGICAGGYILFLCSFPPYCQYYISYCTYFCLFLELQHKVAVYSYIFAFLYCRRMIILTYMSCDVMNWLF
jgi:hypothetical protein